MKINSRKFFVWVVWLIFAILAVVFKQITESLILWFGIVSCMYIGGNVVQKFVEPILSAFIKKE